MKAYFCEKTDKRLVAPGVSKSFDPVNGVDEFNESAPAPGVSKSFGSGPQSTKEAGAKSSGKKSSE